MTTNPVPHEGTNAPTPEPAADVLLAIRTALDGTAADYAADLVRAGFTVYLPKRVDRRPVGWFHYSQIVDGRECFGIYHDGRDGFEGAYHTMPITPSRLNGSSAHVGAKWGDDLTLGMDDLGPESVEMARIIARPENWCPFNAEPTPEARVRANADKPTPQRFYQGATLANDPHPWGIGTAYVPASEFAAFARLSAEANR